MYAWLPSEIALQTLSSRIVSTDAPFRFTLKAYGAFHPVDANVLRLAFRSLFAPNFAQPRQRSSLFFARNAHHPLRFSYD